MMAMSKPDLNAVGGVRVAIVGAGFTGSLLAVHLGFVMALFLTMPYGKFAHGIYRGAALLKWSIERRQPNRLRVGPE